MRLTNALLLGIWAGLACAGVLRRAEETPTATLASPKATVLGKAEDGIENFSGIPYAEPPTGSLRLKPPQRLTRSLGVFDGTKDAGSCPQFLASTESKNLLERIHGSLANLPLVQNITGQSEDCLTLNVQRPAGVSKDAKLPVFYWIFGGGFEAGSSSSIDGSSLVKYAQSIGKPFIFVAVNYRVGGFGFLAGKEILADGASNLGLLDQRMGLEWVADNIASFGGDPERVTIAGGSAGAMSVLDQMALFGGEYKYRGNPLFHGALMSSGNVLPAEPVDSPRAQEVYDGVVEAGGCAHETDTLECLRGLDYQAFLNAASVPEDFVAYSGIALSYLPRPDGHVLPDSPDVLVQQGKYAPVPFIVGDQEDEGTIFSLFQTNVTTREDLISYCHDVLWKGATEDQVTELVDTYNTGAAAVREGSPFRTGDANEVSPGFKRRAALIGDAYLTLSRRAFLEVANDVHPEAPSWSYLATYNHDTPILGTYHGSDSQKVFEGTPDNVAAKSTRTYFINFIHSLDPNGGQPGENLEWPRWAKARELVNFESDKTTLLKDDFRSDSYSVIKKIRGALRL